MIHGALDFEIGYGGGSTHDATETTVEGDKVFVFAFEEVTGFAGLDEFLTSFFASRFLRIGQVGKLNAVGVLKLANIFLVFLILGFIGVMGILAFTFVHFLEEVVPVFVDSGDVEVLEFTGLRGTVMHESFSNAGINFALVVGRIPIWNGGLVVARLSKQTEGYRGLISEVILEEGSAVSVVIE